MRAFWIVAVGSVAIISLISVVVGWWFCGLDAALFGGVVGGLITAVATLALIWVGIKQLQELAKTANADFALRRADQFFQPRTRTLFHLIEDGYLLFEEKTPFRDLYFMVDERKLTEVKLA